MKISGSLWQYYRDEPALDNNTNIIHFPTNGNNSTSFKFKVQLTGQAGNNGTKDVQIMVQNSEFKILTKNSMFLL